MVVRTPLENHKKYCFFSNTGPDPLENHKATKPAFIVGLSQPASEIPFKCRYAGGRMMARFQCDMVLCPILINLNKKTSELDPLASDKTFWIRACFSNLPVSLVAHKWDKNCNSFEQTMMQSHKSQCLIMNCMACCNKEYFSPFHSDGFSHPS